MLSVVKIVKRELANYRKMNMENRWMILTDKHKKVKFALQQATKAQRGITGTALCCL